MGLTESKLASKPAEAALRTLPKGYGLASREPEIKNEHKNKHKNVHHRPVHNAMRGCGCAWECTCNLQDIEINKNFDNEIETAIRESQESINIQ